jgi:hypothetical protein
MSSTSAVMDDVIAGAAIDVTVSADAMRWSPSLARSAERGGLDCGTGVGAALRPYLRRLAARAASPFVEVAVDLLDEVRGLHGPRLRRRRSSPAPS